MISTSSYKKCNSDKYTTYSISGDRGKDAGYEGNCYQKLAPKLSFWKVWHDNIGIIPEEENNRYYVEEYYKQVLSQLDPQQVYKELDNSILLCYEDNTEFCHRAIVAAWLQILLEIEVPEIKVDEYTIVEIDRPSYIREYLEDAMRKDRNMRGFNSLRGLYLFEKGEKLEEKARELPEEDRYWEIYMQQACFFRCDADAAEEKYNQNKQKKLIK